MCFRTDFCFLEDCHYLSFLSTIVSSGVSLQLLSNNAPIGGPVYRLSTICPEIGNYSIPPGAICLVMVMMSQ